MLRKRTSGLLILLASLSVLSGCRTTASPTVTPCVILENMTARCYPPLGGKEYVLLEDQLPGGIWFFPSDYAEIKNYIWDLERQLGVSKPTQ